MGGIRWRVLLGGSRWRAFLVRRLEGRRLADGCIRRLLGVRLLGVGSCSLVFQRLLRTTRLVLMPEERKLSEKFTANYTTLEYL